MIGTNADISCSSHRRKALIIIVNSPNVSQRSGVASNIRSGLMIELIIARSSARARNAITPPSILNEPLNKFSV